LVEIFWFWLGPLNPFHVLLRRHGALLRFQPLVPTRLSGRGM
jgi:hypothetical protein